MILSDRRRHQRQHLIVKPKTLLARWNSLKQITNRLDLTHAKYYETYTSFHWNINKWNAMRRFYLRSVYIVYINRLHWFRPDKTTLFLGSEYEGAFRQCQYYGHHWLFEADQYLSKAMITVVHIITVQNWVVDKFWCLHQLTSLR